MTMFSPTRPDDPAHRPVIVRGGDGRGKTTLLKILAGTLKPSAGQVLWVADSSPTSSTTTAQVFLADPDGERDSATTARAWLDAMRLRFAHWDCDLEDDLIEAFALADHMTKSMLSTGTRRKVALVAAFSSRADLVLLEKPFAALDGRSREVVTELLLEAAEHPSRGWVLADYELPVGLTTAALAQVQVQVVDLGD